MLCCWIVAQTPAMNHPSSSISYLIVWVQWWRRRWCPASGRPSPFVGTGLDESTDRASEKHLAVTIQHVSGGKCFTSFLECVNVYDGKATLIFSALKVKEVASKYHFNMRKVVGLGTDGGKRDGQWPKRSEWPHCSRQPTPCIRAVCVPPPQLGCVAGMCWHSGHGNAAVPHISGVRLCTVESDKTGAVQGNGCGACSWCLETQTHLRYQVRYLHL